MTQESEKFGGDTVLTGQEFMTSIRNQMYNWTDNAMKIFTRHQMEVGKEHPDEIDMMKMNNAIETLLSQYNIRLTGENGVATGVIFLSNSLEQWDNRFNTLLHGSNPLPDQEWLRFYQMLDEWMISLDDTVAIIGSTQKEEQRRDGITHKEITVQEVLKKAHKWVSSTINGVDSEDAKLVEAVGNLHTEMVKWMVQMLLHLAPDLPTHSDEAKEAVLLGSATIGQLEANAKSLFTRISDFTNYVTHCCKTIVTEDMQQKLEQRVENADMEYKALHKLGMECNEWINVAKLMLSELTGETFSDTAKVNLNMLSESKKLLIDQQPSAEQPSVEQPEAEQEQEQPRLAESQTNREDDESYERTPSSQHEVSVTPANQISDTPTPAANQSEEPPAPPITQEVKDETSAAVEEKETEPVQEQQATEAIDETSSETGKEQIEVIGHDANTHKKILEQNPEEAPPHDGITSIIADIPATPDTKRAYEALAALETLQKQLLATEERAQGAESKASTLEAELKQAQERIRALERQFGVKEEKVEEVPEPADEPAPAIKTSDAETEKSEKLKPKTKEKSTVSSRSSSRASSKSKKK